MTSFADLVQDAKPTIKPFSTDGVKPVNKTYDTGSVLSLVRPEVRRDKIIGTSFTDHFIGQVFDDRPFSERIKDAERVGTRDKQHAEQEQWTKEWVANQTRLFNALYAAENTGDEKAIKAASLEITNTLRRETDAKWQVQQSRMVRGLIGETLRRGTFSAAIAGADRELSIREITTRAITTANEGLSDELKWQFGTADQAKLEGITGQMLDGYREILSQNEDVLAFVQEKLGGVPGSSGVTSEILAAWDQDKIRLAQVIMGEIAIQKRETTGERGLGGEALESAKGTFVDFSHAYRQLYNGLIRLTALGDEKVVEKLGLETTEKVLEIDKALERVRRTADPIETNGLLEEMLVMSAAQIPNIAITTGLRKFGGQKVALGHLTVTQGVPLYNDMIERGIDPSIALPVSVFFGVGMAKLEDIQINKLLGLAKAPKGLFLDIHRTIGQRLRGLAVRQSVGVGAEYATELAQSVAEISADVVGTKLSQWAGRDIKFDKERYKKQFEETARESWKAIVPLVGVGTIPAAFGTFRGARQQKNVRTALVNELSGLVGPDQAEQQIGALVDELETGTSLSDAIFKTLEAPVQKERARVLETARLRASKVVGREIPVAEWNTGIGGLLNTMAVSLASLQQISLPAAMNKVFKTLTGAELDRGTVMEGIDRSGELETPVEAPEVDETGDVPAPKESLVDWLGQIREALDQQRERVESEADTEQQIDEAGNIQFPEPKPDDIPNSTKSLNTTDFLRATFRGWRSQMSEEFQGKLARSLGNADGVWTPALEQEAEKGFLRWLWTGSAKTDDTRATFKQLSKWVRREYGSKMNGPRAEPINTKLSPQTRKLFRQMFGGEWPVMEAIRRTRESMQLDETTFQDRGKLRQLADGMLRWVDYSDPVRKFAPGQRLVEIGDDVEARTRRLGGRLLREVDELSSRSKRGDFKWLDQTDEFGISNVQKLVEGNLAPPNETILEWRDKIRDAQETLGIAAEEAGVYVRAGRGLRRFVRREGGRAMPRYLTALGKEILKREGHTLRPVLRQAIAAANPDLDTASLSAKVDQYQDGLSKKHVGAIEYERVFTNMPSYIVDKKGKKRQILETNPANIMRKAIHSQARRIAIVELVGDDKITNKSGKNSTMTFRKVLRTMGMSTKMTPGMLERNLENAGVPADVIATAQGKMPKLRRLAQAANVSNTREMSRLNIIDAMQNLTELSPEQEAALKKDNGKLLKELRGIDIDAGGVDLLDALQRRSIDPTSDMFRELESEFVAEGGNQKHFQDVANLIQGVPTEDPGGIGYKIASPFLSTIGSFMISGAWVPNLVQPMLVLPFVTQGNPVRGIRVFAKGVAKTFGGSVGLLNEETVQRAFDAGVIDNVRSAHQLDPVSMDNISRGIRRFVGSATTLSWQLHKNNVMTAAIGFELLEDWSNNGMTTGDRDVARTLRLSDAEIAEIESGKVSPHVETKLVHALVSKTQALTESAHRQGVLTSNRVWRQIFPFQSFSSMQGRRIVELTRLMGEGMKELAENGSPKKFGRSFRLLMTTAASYGMAGTLTQAMRREFWNKRDREEWEKPAALEGMFNEFLLGILDIQFLGPVTRIVVDPAEYNSDEANFLASLVPKINAIAKAGFIGYNIVAQKLGTRTLGEQGQLSAGRQATAWLRRNASAARLVMNQVDKQLFPYLDKWRDSRSVVGAWKRNKRVLEDKPPEATLRVQKNPLYLDIREALRRGDADRIEESKTAYFKEQDKAGVDILSASRNLRSALMGDRPINLSPINYIQFMQDMLKRDPKRREEILRTNNKYLQMLNQATIPDLVNG